MEPQYVSEREKTLEQEVVFLRNELNQLKEQKVNLQTRLEDVRYELNEKLEDQVEDMQRHVATLQAALDARCETLGEGDLFLIDDQEVANSFDKSMLMQITKKYGCNFVAMAGLDHVTKLTDEQLEKMNLRKISAGERSTATEKLQSILVSVKSVHNEVDWTKEEFDIIFQIESSLGACINVFKQFEDLVNLRGKKV